MSEVKRYDMRGDEDEIILCKFNEWQIYRW